MDFPHTARRDINTCTGADPGQGRLHGKHGSDHSFSDPLPRPAKASDSGSTGRDVAPFAGTQVVLYKLILDFFLEIFRGLWCLCTLWMVHILEINGFLKLLLSELQPGFGLRIKMVIQVWGCHVIMWQSYLKKKQHLVVAARSITNSCGVKVSFKVKVGSSCGPQQNT